MKLITLSKNKFTMVDDEDFKWLNHWKWSYLDNRSGYAVRGEYKYINGKIKRRSIYMHRLIFPCPVGKQIDHIDGNSLNNQKRNLRFCIPSQNSFNQKIRVDSSSGYKNIRFINTPGRRKKWCVSVRSKNAHKSAYFYTLEEAIKYADIWRKEIHGKFASNRTHHSGSAPLGSERNASL